MYGYVPSTPITAPDLKKAYFISTNRTQIALEFAQAVQWTNAGKDLIYLDYQAGKVASGSVAGTTIKLYLTAASTNTTITYVNDQAPWNSAMTNGMIYGSNGVAALTFADVPIIPPTPPMTVLSGLVVWLKADAVDTNDTVNEVRKAGSDIFVKQWDDMTAALHRRRIERQARATVRQD